MFPKRCANFGDERIALAVKTRTHLIVGISLALAVAPLVSVRQHGIRAKDANAGDFKAADLKERDVKSSSAAQDDQIDHPERLRIGQYFVRQPVSVEIARRAGDLGIPISRLYDSATIAWW